MGAEPVRDERASDVTREPLGCGDHGAGRGASALDHLMAYRPGKSQPFALFLLKNKKMVLVNLKGTHCSIMAILATAFYSLQMPLTS